MTSYLLAIAIGPVQDFIAAARRTRDLWFGSHLLSEISKAVARSLNNCSNVELIFPYFDNLDNALKENSEENIVNQIIVKVDGDIDAVKELAKIAKDAAQNHWQHLAEGVYKKYPDLIKSDIWNAQHKDIIEVYTAWCPLLVDYQNDRKNLMRLLSGRKNTRDFSPGRGYPVPKSLLDGARESVLRLYLSEDQLNQCRALGIKVTKNGTCEPLDITGVVKRIASKDKNYPSISRIATNPWIRTLEKDDIKKFTDKINEIENFAKTINDEEKPIISKIIVKENPQNKEKKYYPQYERFPYDGTILFTDRYTSIAEEAGINNTNEEANNKEAKKLKSLFDELQSLLEKSNYTKIMAYPPLIWLYSVLTATRLAMHSEKFKTSKNTKVFQKLYRNLPKKHVVLWKNIKAFVFMPAVMMCLLYYHWINVLNVHVNYLFNLKKC